MRFVVVFFVVAGLWLVIGDYWNGKRVIDGLAGLIDSGRVDADAPNWGDVAAKIGELSQERHVLKDGLSASPTALEDPGPEIRGPAPKPR